MRRDGGQAIRSETNAISGPARGGFAPSGEDHQGLSRPLGGLTALLPLFLCLLLYSLLRVLLGEPGLATQGAAVWGACCQCLSCAYHGVAFDLETSMSPTCWRRMSKVRKGGQP